MIGRIDDYSEELNRRVDAWSQRFSIGSMSQNELAANVTALRDASTRSVVENVASADFEELMGRIEPSVRPRSAHDGCAGVLTALSYALVEAALVLLQRGVDAEGRGHDE